MVSISDQLQAFNLYAIMLFKVNDLKNIFIGILVYLHMLIWFINISMFIQKGTYLPNIYLSTCQVVFQINLHDN